MKKQLTIFASLITVFALGALLLATILDTATFSVAYLVTALCALIVMTGYVLLAKRKDRWFILLFVAIFCVNSGYFMLSVCKTTALALWANRISYLGSVFLPLSLTVIIFNVTGIKYPKTLHLWLTALAGAVFLVTASPGISGIYYKSQQLVTGHGISILQKEYGPLHIMYMFYLVLYFATMVFAVARSYLKNKSASPTFAIMLSVSVLINIIVWLIEQFTDNEFEFLSISYVICELFLLGLSVIEAENKRLHSLMDNNVCRATPPPATEPVNIDKQTIKAFEHGVGTLTNTERNIYELYTAGKSSKDVMAELMITENTLKFHNKNIYAKLQVPSRKRLREIYNYMNNKTQAR